MKPPRSSRPLSALLACIAVFQSAAALPPAPPDAVPCSEPAPGAPRPIVGTPWRLEDLDRKGIIDRSRITLELAADGRIGGDAGCNRYTGSYRLTDGALRIDERIASTRMACVAASLMYQEQRFFELLPTMTDVRLDETGALILASPDGATMTFRLDEDAVRERAGAPQPTP